MNLFHELKRRNVFKVGIAYLVLAWVVIQVTDTAVPALHLPDWVNSLVFLLGLLGFPFALFFAWVFELTSEGIKKESEIYLALAKKQEASAIDLAKATFTNRTVCYNILQQLVEKGIIAYSKKNNRRVFSVADPENLLANIREKEDLAKDVIKDLKKIKKRDSKL